VEISFVEFTKRPLTTRENPGLLNIVEHMKKIFLPVVVIIVLIIGLLAAVLLSGQQATIRNKAAVTGGIGKIGLNPSTITKYVGDSFPVNITMNTGGASISSISMRITYPYTGTGAPQLDVVDSTGVVSSQIFPDSALTSTGDWAFPVKSVTRAGGLVTIDFAAINNNIAGYSNTTNTNLATIYFKVNAAASSNPIALTFDTSNSKMLTKSNPADILGIPTNASYTIIADTAAPSAISDLRVTSTSTSSANIAWTAPSDVGPLGKASTYDIRYATAAITDANFSLASVASNIPAPATSGTSQNLTLSGLSSSTTYFFAIKSKDAVGNISAISNVPSGTTQQPCVNNLPTLSLTPSSQTGKATQQLTYTLSILNTNTGSCGNTTFSYNVNVGTTGHWVASTPNPASMTLANSASGSANITVTPDSTVTNGTYPFTVNVTAPAGTNSTTANYIVLNLASMNLKVKFQGINTTAAGKTVTVTLKNAGTTTSVYTQQINLTSDIAGVYSGIASNINPATYDVYIKEQVHLQKKFVNIVLASNANSEDWTATPMLAGDFNNDNVINIVDIGQILSAYTALSTPVTSSNLTFDVNSDSVIDITDIALALSNYTALNVPGD
jgi:hypothetical protein